MTTRSDALSHQDSEPEDILSTSLSTLYEYAPITHSSAGALFTYSHSPNHDVSDAPKIISLRTPDTHASNWSLHASSIWVSSIFLADHITELALDGPRRQTVTHVLELGAGAGLPGILIATIYPDVLVTVSDYPDKELINTLSENVSRNGVGNRCRALAYAWGSDCSVLFSGRGSQEAPGFDVIVAADTLWNPASHQIFIETLKMALRKNAGARVHLVVGLHTGRYTIQSFMDPVGKAGFDIETIDEREVRGDASRPWDISLAENEDERERRRWLVWIILKWSLEHLDDI